MKLSSYAYANLFTKNLSPFVLLFSIFIVNNHANALTLRTWDGGAGTSNFNTAANWSGDILPSSSDSVVINVTSDKTIVLSGSITVGALYLFSNGSNVNLYVDCVSYLLTINGNLHMKATGNTNTDLNLDLGSSAGGVSIGRHAYIDDGGAQQSFIISDLSSPGMFKLYGNLILGAHGRTLATYEPNVILDGTSTQTITINNTDTYFLGENVTIGSTNNPTVTLTGSGLIAGFGCYDGNFTLNGSSILDIAAFTIDRIASSGGTFIMNSTSSLKIGSTADFPASYGSYSLNSTSKTYYYGTSQSVTALTYGNLYLQTSGTKTVSGSTVVNGEMATSGTVTLDANAVIDFNGNVTIGSGTTFLGGATTNTVAGNWINNGTFTRETSTYSFDGSSLQDISGSSVTTFNNLTVNNTSNVNITQGPTVNGILTFTNGNILASSISEPIVIETTGSTTGAANTKCVVGYCQKNTVSTAKFTFPIGSSTLYRPMAVTPSGAGATSWLTKYFPAGYGDYTVVDVTNITHVEYWTLDRSGASPVNSTIELSWNTNTDIGTYYANFVVAHFNGTDWESAGGNNITGNSSSGTLSSNANWNSYSPFTIATNTSIPLPIELLSFEAIKNDKHIGIHWSTANELNSDYFTVERSFDGHHFSPLTRVDAAGTSNITLNYNTNDYDYVAGINYYKLIQTDFNGDEIVSKIISIDMSNIKIVKINTVNSLGQVVNDHYVGVVFDVYSDGTSLKRMQ